jgi:peptide/nickel transport system ATP-binding protein
MDAARSPNIHASVKSALELCGLSVSLPSDGDRALAIDNVSLTANRGEILCVVGESGSGKSMIAYSVMGLLPRGLKTTGGSIRLEGEELLVASPARRRTLRG